MTYDRYDRFIEQVSHRAGFTDPRDAERAVEATMTALGETVDRLVAFQVADRVPLEVGTPLRTTRFRGFPDRAAFYDRVRELEELEEAYQGFAREHANAVFSVLADTLDPENRTLLSKDLPEDVAALLQRPETLGSANGFRSPPPGAPSRDGNAAGSPHPTYATHAAHATHATHGRTNGTANQTLATGRPAHANSPAAMPDAAPPGSLIREPNPRGNTKLATTEGPTAERQGRTPGEAKPPLAEQAEQAEQAELAKRDKS
jgi:uncharacterized protein (DUF2267 family)